MPQTSLGQQRADELRRQGDLPITVVSATLAMLELKGLIRQSGAKQARIRNCYL